MPDEWIFFCEREFNSDTFNKRFLNFKNHWIKGVTAGVIPFHISNIFQFLKYVHPTKVKAVIYTRAYDPRIDSVSGLPCFTYGNLPEFINRKRLETQIQKSFLCSELHFEGSKYDDKRISQVKRDLIDACYESAFTDPSDIELCSQIDDTIAQYKERLIELEWDFIVKSNTTDRFIPQTSQTTGGAILNDGVLIIPAILIQTGNYLRDSILTRCLIEPIISSLVKKCETIIHLFDRDINYGLFKRASSKAYNFEDFLLNLMYNNETNHYIRSNSQTKDGYLDLTSQLDFINKILSQYKGREFCIDWTKLKV